MEGIINPLVVRDPMRCAACGNEWLAYDLSSDSEEPGLVCPRCGSAEVSRADR